MYHGQLVASRLVCIIIAGLLTTFATNGSLLASLLDVYDRSSCDNVIRTIVSTVLIQLDVKHTMSSIPTLWC